MNGEDDAVTEARTSALTNPDYEATKVADAATAAAARMAKAIDEYVTGDLASGAARLRALYNNEAAPEPVRQPRNDFEDAY